MLVQRIGSRLWVQVWVQLNEEKWLPIFRKRHQIGHLDFRSFRLLTEGLGRNHIPYNNRGDLEREPVSDAGQSIWNSCFLCQKADGQASRKEADLVHSWYTLTCKSGYLSATESSANY